MKKILTSRKTTEHVHLCTGGNISVKADALEFMKCRDPVYFIEKFVVQNHPIHGCTPMVLYEYQKEYVQAMHAGSVIAKMGRQLGKTTLDLAFTLWMAIFKLNSQLMLIGLCRLLTTNMLQHLQMMIEHLPAWLNPAATMNKSMIEFQNGSQIHLDVARAGLENVLSGKSFSMVVLDEFAYFPENAQESILYAAAPCLAAGFGKLVISSTINQEKDLFQELYSAAEQGTAPLGMTPFKATWCDHPERDIDWAEEQQCFMGKEMFIREYMCTFNG